MSNRIIKFRAWLPSEGGWLAEGFSLSMDGLFWNDDNCKEWPVKDNLILMQFTGLLDKNGKEIYEGDIVNLFWPFVGATYRCKVFWHTEFARWAMEELRPNGIFHYFGTQDTKLMDIEKIGDEFSTPELLSGLTLKEETAKSAAPEGLIISNGTGITE